MKKGDEKVFIAVAAFLTLVIFIVGLFIPLGIAAAMPYVFMVLLTLWVPGKKYTYAAGIITSILIIAQTFFAPDPHIDWTMLLVTRIIKLTGIWAATFVVLRFKGIQISEKRNKEQMNALFQYATEGILIIDQKGEIVLLNPMLEKIFGYKKDELLGKKIEKLIPDKFGKEHELHRDQYFYTPHARPMGNGMELFARRKDGSEFPVEVSLNYFIITEGKFVIAFLTDITERKRQDEALRKEKERLQRYLDIAPVIFVVINKDQTVTRINKEGCHLLGYDEKDILGKNWFDNFLPKNIVDADKHYFNMSVLGKQKIVGFYESYILRKDGTQRLMYWKTSFIYDESENITAILSAGEDITEKRKQEGVIRKANQELAQYSIALETSNKDLEKRVEHRTEALATAINELAKSQRDLQTALSKERELNELKSRFVTTASHEFRTPLATILSSTSLIARYDKTEDSDKRQKHVNRIKSSISNLTEILNDFLSLGKLEEGLVKNNPEEFEIISFAQSIIDEMKNIAKENQQIIFSHSGKRASVAFDKHLLKNVVLNLLSNAIKYSPAGKNIEFKTDCSENWLLIKIVDQGIGIPQEDQKHLFERFFRAKNSANIQGTGLGLNIVKKYVDLMNGEVSFSSALNEGTTIILKLPVNQDALSS